MLRLIVLLFAVGIAAPAFADSGNHYGNGDQTGTAGGGNNTGGNSGWGKGGTQYGNGK